MAVDPKGMEAVVNDEESKKKKTAKPEKAKDDEEEAPESEDEEESDEEKEAEGDLEEKYPTMFGLLEENGEMFEEATETLDHDALTSESGEFKDDDAELFSDAVASLPEDLVKAIKKEAKDITWDEAMEVAEALEVGEHIEDPDCTAGFIFHIAHAA